MNQQLYNKYSRIYDENLIRLGDTCKALDKIQAKISFLLAEKKRLMYLMNEVSWPWSVRPPSHRFRVGNIAACVVQKEYRMDNPTFDHLPFVGWQGETHVGLRDGVWIDGDDLHCPENEWNWGGITST